LALVYNIVARLSSGALAAGEEAEFVKAVEKTIATSQTAIEKMAGEMEKVNDIYLLGRSTHYPIALEGALKLKELAYVHAEGVAAGELKHGPLALMEKNTLVILLNPRDATYNDSVSNAHEIKARGASVIGISDAKSEVYDHWIEIPHMAEEAFYPIVEVIPLQMLAYYLALAKNADPDYPRNLAKSVTVK
jgi:glucosamine--fructose-6-phosphate aminotransferase (isomerizing)